MFCEGRSIQIAFQLNVFPILSVDDVFLQPIIHSQIAFTMITLTYPNSYDRLRSLTLINAVPLWLLQVRVLLRVLCGYSEATVHVATIEYPQYPQRYYNLTSYSSRSGTALCDSQLEGI